MRKFVVAAAPLTPTESKAVTDLFRERYKWWHWIDGLWLVKDESDSLTVAAIRDLIMAAAPKARTMVLDVTGSGNTWSGFGPSSPTKNMFKWIRETWRDHQ